jgi:mRNA interferase RelE/StbE
VKATTIQVTARALKDLEEIPAAIGARILRGIENLIPDLGGNVRHLSNFQPDYRLRVGDYRVLFSVEGSLITICRVRHRSKAYRKEN